MPRERMATKVAAISPNTAPEAPDGELVGSWTSTANDPPSSDMK